MQTIVPWYCQDTPWGFNIGCGGVGDYGTSNRFYDGDAKRWYKTMKMTSFRRKVNLLWLFRSSAAVDALAASLYTTALVQIYCLKPLFCLSIQQVQLHLLSSRCTWGALTSNIQLLNICMDVGAHEYGIHSTSIYILHIVCCKYPLSSSQHHLFIYSGPAAAWRITLCCCIFTHFTMCVS